MKQLLLLFTTIFLTSGIWSQGLIAKEITKDRAAGKFGKVQNIFTASRTFAPVKGIKAAHYFGMMPVTVGKSAYLAMNVPTYGNLYLKQVQSDTRILTSKGTMIMPVIAHYRGTDAAGNLAAISITNGEVMGLISTAQGNINISKSGAQHVIFNDKDLAKKDTFHCDTRQLPRTLHRAAVSSIPGNHCVTWYWETDYDIFVQKGSAEAVSTYILGVFNQVQTLYANDGITVKLGTLKINTVQDSYTGPGTGNFLDQFGAQVSAHPFTEDFGTLIGYNGGGGIAWVNSYCNEIQYRCAYCGIGSSYSGVPTFSWTIEVLTHENGHLLGCNHTHDPVWTVNGIPNTRIDSCGDAAGYCSHAPCPTPPISLPISGGTIMSYCHLTSAGINFNKGFGPQPRDLMQARIFTVSCLGTCDTIVTPPPPPGICPVGYHKDTINVRIDSTNSGVKVISTGGTNYKYVWSKNGVKQSWATQVIRKGYYASRDVLKVVVSSSNKPTIQHCYIPGSAKIIIK